MADTHRSAATRGSGGGTAPFTSSQLLDDPDDAATTPPLRYEGGVDAGDREGPEAGWWVHLHVYDLTKGWMKKLSKDLFGTQVDGLYHTGIAVYGREYFFEGGITSMTAGRTRFGRPDAEHNERRRLGRTQIPQEQFEMWLRHQERPKPEGGGYGRLGYHLVDKNCNHFTHDALRLPLLMKTSSIGRLFAPVVDAFFGGWQWWHDWDEQPAPAREGRAGRWDGSKAAGCPRIKQLQG
eukprot:gene31241-12863_t